MSDFGEYLICYNKNKFSESLSKIVECKCLKLSYISKNCVYITCNNINIKNIDLCKCNNNINKIQISNLQNINKNFINKHSQECITKSIINKNGCFSKKSIARFALIFNRIVINFIDICKEESNFKYTNYNFTNTINYSNNNNIIKDYKLDIITKNKYNQQLKNNLFIKFSAKYIPKFSLTDYIKKLKTFSLDINIYIYASILIERLIKLGYNITHNNKYTLFLTSFVISSKLLNDSIYVNSNYAYIGGISISKLNKLENIFLKLLDYNIFISCSNFYFYEEFIFSVM